MVGDINELQAYLLHFDAFLPTQLGQPGSLVAIAV
jgi:hypothetical protein